jgi:hypothetical protein
MNFLGPFVIIDIKDRSSNYNPMRYRAGSLRLDAGG